MYKLKTVTTIKSELQQPLEVFKSKSQPVFGKVKKIVAEQLGVEDEKIIPIANFANDLGADSLDTVELVMALEEEFDIEIPDEAAEKITTVQEAVDYINSKVAASAQHREYRQQIIRDWGELER